jgi:predicted amidohydrolase YtcJ
MIVFTGGIVRTMDPSRPVASSLVVEGERIVALDQAPAGARRVDLHGGCLLPGFTDSHVHFPTWAVTRRELQLHGTRDEVLARVADAVPSVPHGRWLRGFGWTGFEPSLEALDAVTRDVPVALRSRMRRVTSSGPAEWSTSMPASCARRPRGRSATASRWRRTRRWSRPRGRRCRSRPPGA